MGDMSGIGFNIFDDDGDDTFGTESCQPSTGSSQAASQPNPLQNTCSMDESQPEESSQAALQPSPLNREKSQADLQPSPSQSCSSKRQSSGTSGDEAPYSIDFHPEHLACSRKSIANPKAPLEWGEWVLPEEDAAENDPMICKFSKEPVAHYTVLEFMVADFKAGQIKRNQKASTGSEKDRSSKIAVLYEAAHPRDGVKVRVRVKPDVAPLPVMELKPTTGAGSWKQKCQCSATMAGSLDKATSIIRKVAEAYIAERVEPTDFYEQRDAFLKEDMSQGAIRQVAMYGS